MLALQHGPLLQWRSSTKQFLEQVSPNSCLLGRGRHLERHVAQVATPSPFVCAHERLACARSGPALRSRVRVGASVQEASPPPGSPPRPPARRTTGRIGGARDEAYFKNLGVAFRWGTQFNVDDLNSILVRVRTEDEKEGSCVWLGALKCFSVCPDITSPNKSPSMHLAVWVSLPEPGAAESRPGGLGSLPAGRSRAATGQRSAQPTHWLCEGVQRRDAGGCDMGCRGEKIGGGLRCLWILIYSVISGTVLCNSCRMVPLLNLLSNSIPNVSLKQLGHITFQVDPDWRCLGVGRALVRQLTGRLVQDGIDLVSLFAGKFGAGGDGKGYLYRLAVSHRGSLTAHLTSCVVHSDSLARSLAIHAQMIDWSACMRSWALRASQGPFFPCS